MGLGQNKLWFCGFVSLSVELWLIFGQLCQQHSAIGQTQEVVARINMDQFLVGYQSLHVICSGCPLQKNDRIGQLLTDFRVRRWRRRMFGRVVYTVKKPAEGRDAEDGWLGQTSTGLNAPDAVRVSSCFIWPSFLRLDPRI